MFMFNKNNAVPGSSQSSIDSRVTDPSTSTSTSDAWASQSSDVSSYGDFPSPERQESIFSGKRGSVFTLRSRSNTATSLSPSFTSFSSSMTSDTRRSSQDLRHLTGHSSTEPPGTRRSIFTRGKKSKRSSVQYYQGGGIAENEDMDVGDKRMSFLRKGRRVPNQSDSSTRSLKHRISSPFDFQHVSHAGRNQIESAIEEASEHDLLAEFWNVCTSQTPQPELTGIRADHLHFHNFSSENLATTEPRSQSAASYRSPPLSPQSSRESGQPGSPLRETSSAPLRPSRSVESFSQPGLQNRFHRPSQSVNAPSRMPLRLALAPIDDLPEEATENQMLPPQSASSIRNSGIWDLYAPVHSSTALETLPTIADEPDYIAHAVTTPDNTAILSTPPFTPGVKEIQEDFDWFAKPRPAPHPPAKSPRAPYFESFSFRNIQRSPVARSNNRTSPFTSPKTTTQRNTMTRPISQISETLGSPKLAHRNSVRRASIARRKSNTWRGIEDSWEDDIDYIYDNALEADCDLDWEQISEHGASEDRDSTPEQSDFEQRVPDSSHDMQAPEQIIQEEPAISSSLYSRPFRPSLLVPCSSHVPELVSAVSNSTASTGVRTPSDFFSVMGHQTTRFAGPESFPPTTPLLGSPDMKDFSPEQMYNDLLAEYAGSDRHVPLIDASHSITSSTRSSHVRSSKRSSYDSSLMSSGVTSGTWSSPVRRSASSSGSLPELVHSRRARKDFNMAVDQLSDQVASFTMLSQEDAGQNEDDDATPPGRPLQSQTFFTSDDEDTLSSQDKSTVEGEVRASLELARQGSQRTSRAPLLHHKYASSDGATQLLSSSIQITPEVKEFSQNRKRAATSPHAPGNDRQAYLSLFPIPPTHSPLASPTSTQH